MTTLSRILHGAWDSAPRCLEPLLIPADEEPDPAPLELLLSRCNDSLDVPLPLLVAACCDVEDLDVPPLDAALELPAPQVPLDDAEENPT